MIRVMRFLLLIVVITCVAACTNGSSKADAPARKPVAQDKSALLDRDFWSVSVIGSEIPGGGPLEVSFPSEARIALTAGCNRHTGSVTFSGDQMTVGQLASTMMACMPPKDQADAWLESFVAAVPLKWRLDGTALVLTSGTITVILDQNRTDQTLAPISPT